MADGQRNAADKRQVEAAARAAKDEARLELNDLRGLLSTPQGRRTLWRLLERAGVFKSVMAPDGVIQYQAGKQDFGHELMALIERANPEALFTMMREAQAERSKQRRTRKAVQTPSASEGEHDDADDV